MAPEPSLHACVCHQAYSLPLHMCLIMCFGLWWVPRGIQLGSERKQLIAEAKMKRSVPPLQPLEKPAARKLLSALTARLVHITELFRLWCGLTPCLMPWESHRNAA